MAEKVLVLEHKSFGMVDAIEAFRENGYEVHTFSHQDLYEHNSEGFDRAFEEAIGACFPDYVFSLNYYPILSKNCNRHNIKYISLVYDSPLIALYTYTVIFPCNYIFLFDSAMYLEFKKEHIDTVYYMPLPVNAARYNRMQLSDIGEEAREYLSGEVSFVGALYNESHNLYDRKAAEMPEYTRGYLEGIMAAQRNVYGYYFVQELLKPEIVESWNKVSPYEPAADSVATREYVYAHYFLARKITELERAELLKSVSERFALSLFTHKEPADMPHALFKGAIDYYDVMPYVFKGSKINLNITLRSIRSGIPLRAMDIMGAGGFLLTNYQEDFLRHFEPGRDFVYFTDKSDMLAKIDYYLSHDKERVEIAANGNRKVKEFHNYPRAVKEMMEVVNGQGTQ